MKKKKHLVRRQLFALHDKTDKRRKISEMQKKMSQNILLIYHCITKNKK